MLLELRVRDLGVIEDVTIVLSGAMTALTGETGAGKTLVVDALSLLLGGRADPVLVRPGASQATVEGRFLVDSICKDRLETIFSSSDNRAENGPGDEQEVILTRVVPAVGRSRGWIDGRMATLPDLAQVGAMLVDLHGQHAHQSLFGVAAQRAAIDEFASVDTEPLRVARDRVREISAAIAELGGDAHARAREMDLLRYQVEEIDSAKISDSNEDDSLAALEERLSSAGQLRESALTAAGILDASPRGNVLELLGEVISTLGGHGSLRELTERCQAAAVELSDLTSELREISEHWEDDPVRLGEITARRHLLHDLRRKYGDTLAEVLTFRDSVATRLAELVSSDELADRLANDLIEANDLVGSAASVVGAARRRAAPLLAQAVTENLQRLAMHKATLEVQVGDTDPGDDVVFLLSANPGVPPLPLAKVASGGELARTMLALRLVLTSSPGTLVFDEVDSGVGGEAALAVGKALADLAAGGQVIVVTHLPQVAALADHQLAVRKHVTGERTVSTVTQLEGDERTVELARMLSGQPDSKTARQHAEELLSLATALRCT